MSAAPLEGAYERYAGARSALVFLMQQAAEEGILDPEAGPRSAVEIAVRTGSDSGRIAVLCATLEGYGILSREGQKFTVSDRYREYVPPEATSSLKQVLSSEGKRLELDAPASPGVTREPRTELEMLMDEFRTIAREADVDGWLEGGEGGAGGWSSLPPVVETPRAPEPNLAASEPAPRSEAVLDSQPSTLIPVNQLEPDPDSLVKVKVSRPALVAPRRERSASPVSPAALASAFVRTWPLSPYGIGSIRFRLSFSSLFGLRRLKDGKLRYRLGTALWIIAAGCLLWAVWDLWGTGIGQARAQEDLKAEFARSLAAPADPDANVPSSVPGDAPAPVAFSAPPPNVVAGTSVALIRIPSIGVEEVILEGTSVKDLRRGPGHYVGTAFPGQPGNAAVAGHRTTYGAPFFKLGKLGPGDKILVTTRNGTFTYLVERLRQVAPDDNSPLNPSTENLLTLTTCDPPFSAAKRLIVVARLVGEPDKLPPSTVAPQLIPVATPVPEPVATVGPGLNLNAFRQSQPSPAAGASPSPAGAPGPAAPAAAAPVTEVPTTPTTLPQTTTQPPPTEPPVNNVLVPETQPPPPPPPQETQPPQTQPVPQTQPPPPPVQGECSDGIDNDNDGKTDLADRASCHGDPTSNE